MSAPAIAFDATPLQNGHRYRGIGTYVRGLADGLRRQGEIPIEFWGWAGPDLIDVPPPHRAVGLRRFPMPDYRGAWLFAQLAMRRRAATSNVRVVHITDPDALTPLPKRTLLTTAYDLIPLKQGIPTRRLLARLGYTAYLRALRSADMVFAISEYTAFDLADQLKIPRPRIVVARPGIERPPSPTDISTARGPYFLFLGGPNPNKNLAVLIDAMASCPDLREELLIAGHWLPKQIAQLDAELKARAMQTRVRHIGFVPGAELTGLMRRATAMVIPSLYEGFGLPVGEGLAAGALVVHSRIPVLEEVSAGAAMTFDPWSADELAACLRRAVSDARLASRLRELGVKRAQALTWDAAIETTLSVYRATLAG